jgi:flagellar protein FlgJ
MNITQTAALSSMATTPEKPSKLKTAAQQFEALMIGEMLKQVRESNEGGMDGVSDSASESAMGMAESHFAQAIASSGGLGLAKTIEQHLGPAFKRQSDPVPLPSSPPSTSSAK